MSFELLVLGFNIISSHCWDIIPSPYLSTSANKDNIQQLLAGTITTLARTCIMLPADVYF
jgi:hypothetical protein